MKQAMKVTVTIVIPNDVENGRAPVVEVFNTVALTPAEGLMTATAFYLEQVSGYSELYLTQVTMDIAFTDL